MTPPIDPGELALATVGVSALIEGTPPKMGIGKIEEALRIPRRAIALARRLCDGELTYTPMPRAHSYKTLLDKLPKKLSAPDIEGWVNMFPPEAASMAGRFQAVAQEAMDQLRDLFPTSTISSFTGPENIPPDDVRVWRFFSQLELLNDPLRAFELIAVGAILRSQTIAAREVFPTLTAFFDKALYYQLSVHKAAKKSYRVPPRAEQGLSVWLGRRFVDHKPPEPPAPPAPPPPQTGAPSKVAGDLATRNQAAIGNA